MSAFLRPCPTQVSAALAGKAKLYSADIYQISLVDGVTKYYWTNWNQNLTVAGQLYTSRNPWLTRSKWSVKNKAEVSTLNVKMAALNSSWQGGAQLKTQIHNGLFDGASALVSRAYMLTPGDVDSLGAVDFFGGDIGGLDLDGMTAEVKIRSKMNRLDMQTPRNFFKLSCLHGFCDALCTLARASFTTTDAVGASPAATRVFIPWGTPPADPSKYLGGTLAFTSGQNTGSRRNIVEADATGATVIYPFIYTPLVGDTFTRFEGCTKNENDGTTHDCTARSNTQHYRGFRFTPPPQTAY